MKTKVIGLCHRCEHRVRFLEDDQYHPRYECGVGSAVYSCYMYEPVKPVILATDKGDNRSPLAGYLFSARCHAIGLLDGLRVKKLCKGFVKYHSPALASKVMRKAG